MPSAVELVESLSPWPKDGFGLDRIKALLAELGDPQLSYPSIHVVGTNGKSTVTRTTEELLAQAGLAVGAYLSPHVRGWSERIRVRGEEADFQAAVERVRGPAERLGATQFELVTAAALAEFAAAKVDAAVVEAGLGGRYDATNVLDARVVALTNVALDHTDVLGETREQIAAEKLAVVSPGATVIVGEPEWEGMYAEDVGRAAAEAFLERELDGDVEISLPGRFDVVGEDVFAGAHNPAGVEWLLERLPRRDYVVVASILEDKDAEAMLQLLARGGRKLIATSSRSARALPADELARAAAPFFDSVEVEPDPERALDRAARPVLVTGSLYLLMDLNIRLQRIPWESSARG